MCGCVGFKGGVVDEDVDAGKGGSEEAQNVLIIAGWGEDDPQAGPGGPGSRDDLAEGRGGHGTDEDVRPAVPDSSPDAGGVDGAGHVEGRHDTDTR